MTVPFCDLPSQWKAVQAKVEPTMLKMLAAGQFIGGPEIEAFEAEFATYTGAEHCVAVSNGTAALQLCLRALGVGPGDEVVVPANTFIATAEAVGLVGATPVLVDIAEGAVAPSQEQFIEAVTPKTKAIMPVHLYGYPLQLDKLIAFAGERGLAVLEDAAQVHGAHLEGKPIGCQGIAAGYSFYPGKNLGAFGDAGAIVTNSAEFAQLLKQLRDHGQVKKYHHEHLGSNERMDALQAVGLRHKLALLDGWNDRRRQIASRYFEGLGELPGLALNRPAPHQSPCYHLFVVRHEQRDELARFLNERGVQTGMHYPVPVHLTGAFSSLGHQAGSFPQAEKAAATGLSLPIDPFLSDEQVDFVIESIREFARTPQTV